MEYPGLYYDPRRWPTADGYIPWKLFWLRYRQLWAAYALRRLNELKAVSLGIGQAFGSKDGAVTRMIDREIELAGFLERESADQHG